MYLKRLTLQPHQVILKTDPAVVNLIIKLILWKYEVNLVNIAITLGCDV